MIIDSKEIPGFSDLLRDARIKNKLAEGVLNSRCLEKYDVAEEIIRDSVAIQIEAWGLVMDYLGEKHENGNDYKYDMYSGMITLD